MLIPNMNSTDDRSYVQFCIEHSDECNMSGYAKDDEFINDVYNMFEINMIECGNACSKHEAVQAAIDSILYYWNT